MYQVVAAGMPLASAGRVGGPAAAGVNQTAVAAYAAAAAAAAAQGYVHPISILYSFPSYETTELNTF